MKAIDLVNKMVYDSSIAEKGGIVEWRRDFTLRDYFGAKDHKGEMEVATYFYLYSDDEPLTINDLRDPDVVLETDYDGQVIWLWKLED